MNRASICATCARWVVYPCVIGTVRTEAWRCLNGVTGAGQRTECPVYLREPGSEDDPPPVPPPLVDVRESFFIEDVVGGVLIPLLAVLVLSAVIAAAR